MIKSRRILSLLIPVTFFIIGLCTLDHYGETSDEKFDIAIGEFYYHQWSRVGFAGLQERFGELQRNYGPVFNTIVVATHEILYKKFRLLDSTAAYHLPTLLIASALVYLTYHFGVLAGGINCGLLAAVLLALLPRFVGDAQANLKDTPLAFFFTLTLYFAFRARESRSIIWALAAGVALGLTYGIKINALVILVILGCWIFSYPRTWELFSIRSWSLAGVLVVAGYLTVFLVWPYYRSDPFVRFPETYRIFKEVVWNEEILYLGALVQGKQVPWHYPFVMILVTTPLLILGGLCGRLFVRSHDEATASAVSINRLCWVWLILPLAVHGFSGAPMYDGVRHYSMVFPALAILSAGGLIRIWNWLGERSGGSWPLKVTRSLAALGCLMTLLGANIKLHPYQIVFFNSLVGGVKGASSLFDLDYWGLSLKAAGSWLNQNAATGSLVYIPFGIQHFPLDPSKAGASTTFSGMTDYKVIVLRGMQRKLDPLDNYLTPTREPVYTVSVDGAPLLRIFAYPENGVTTTNPTPSVYGESSQVRSPGVRVTRYRDRFFTSRESSFLLDSLASFDCGRSIVREEPTNIDIEGVLSVPSNGPVCFTGFSDDDAMLGIGDDWVLKVASGTTQRRSVVLGEGYYRLRVRYINNLGPGCFRFSQHSGYCGEGDRAPAETVPLGPLSLP